MQQGRVRDNSPNPDASTVLTERLAGLPQADDGHRRVDSLAVPQRLSTSDFGEALQSLVGEKGKGLSANVVVRLKEQWTTEYEEWSRRDLTGKNYVYVWADGIYAKVRLDDDANKKQCLLVLMGATADGKKELIAVLDGYCESEQAGRNCWSI